MFKGYLKDLLVASLVILVSIGLSIGIYHFIKTRNTTGISLKMENNLKELARQQILLDSRIVNDKKINAAMDGILERLTNQISNYTIEILVVDTPEVNAFALPGGLIIVNTGLIGAADNPEEVASVIAHEIGHIEHRDSLNRIIRSLGISTVITLSGSSEAGNVVRDMIQSGVENQFTKQQEEDADSFGFDLMAKSQLNPVHFADFMQKLEAGETKVNKTLQRYLGDHPVLEERIKIAKQKASLFKGPEKKIAVNWKPVRSEIRSMFDNDRYSD